MISLFIETNGREGVQGCAFLEIQGRKILIFVGVIDPRSNNRLTKTPLSMVCEKRKGLQKIGKSPQCDFCDVFTTDTSCAHVYRCTPTHVRAGIWSKICARAEHNQEIFVRGLFPLCTRAREHFRLCAEYIPRFCHPFQSGFLDLDLFRHGSGSVGSL